MGFVVKHTLEHASGRLVYRRAIPPELRSFLAKREHKVTLGRRGEPGLLAKWEATDAEYKALVAKAQRQLVADCDEVDAPKIAYIVEAYRVAELEADALRRWDAEAKSRAETIGAVMRDAGVPMPPASADAAGRWTDSVRYAATALVEAGKALRANGDLEGIAEAWGGTAILTAERAGYLASPTGAGFAGLCIALGSGLITTM
jgi:hypothetical protein